MRAAFYKGTRPGLAGLYNRLVRFIEPGSYSHTEIVFSDGMSASASFLDGGVRFKKIDFSEDRWDFIDLPDSDEENTRKWFFSHDGDKYNLLGQIHFFLGPVKGDKNKFFCSQAMAESLKYKDSWRYGPNLMYAVLSSERAK